MKIRGVICNDKDETKDFESHSIAGFRLSGEVCKKWADGRVRVIVQASWDFDHQLDQNKPYVRCYYMVGQQECHNENN